MTGAAIFFDGLPAILILVDRINRIKQEKKKIL